MTPERWQHIKEIFYGALERPPGERESFIDSACGGDAETRREVSQLISAHQETGEFLAVPAFDVAAKSLARSNRENLTPGESIRHYTVMRAIGTGGMGEVYLAEDTRLGRNVAIKLLRRSVTTETDRILRFEREARAASALNHPNLCTIYEVGEMEDGRPYIVMEYIEGMTLRQRIGQGRLALSEVLDIAAQVGSALSAAHQAGIVHRDIKPENITLRPDGIVKVLDFGLAKLTEQRRDADSTMPTQLRAHTETGMVMGTARYMSPEQARGYPVDAGTDIWSLGIVIYEMTAGYVPFDGATNTDVIVAVLEREPAPLLNHRPQVPAALDRIVTKALRKNRDERYSEIQDLCLDLKTVARELDVERTTPSATEQFEGAQTIKLNRINTKGEDRLHGVPQTSPAHANFTGHLTGTTKPYKRLVTFGLVGVVFVTALIFTFWSALALRKILQYTPDTTSTSASSVRVVPFTSFIGREDHAAFSPDGNQVAFVWDGEKHDNPDIYVKSLSGERPLRITSDPAIDILPAWSPDGQRIAFVRIAGGRFTVYTVPSLGNGAERKLLTLSAPTQKISWSPDSKFIAVSDKDAGQESAAVFLFSPDTGEKHRLTSPPANIYGDFCPTFSPDGLSLAFIRATSEITADVYVMRAAGGEAKQLTTDSRLRFYDQGVVGGLAWTTDSQTIIYTSETGGSPSLWKISMFGGTPERLSVGGVDVFYPTIAANRLAFTQMHGGTPVYQIEVPNSTHPSSGAIRLIASTRSNYSPQFSPDGESITFESDRSGTHEVWVCRRDGTNPTQLTNFDGPHAGSPRWSPDGKQIVFDVHASNIGHIYIVSVEGGPPRRVTSETVDEGLPTWSRDGKWIYFCSNRSGNQQLWKVRAEGGQAVQVTRHGGFTSFESADGKFLYYSKGPPGVWRVPVDGGEETLIHDIPQAGGWGAWTVVDDGIYFINTAVKGAYAIDFFSFATRRVKRITVMQDVNEFVSGLAISPDRQRILYTQQESLAGDIMLVENFR